VTVCVAGGADEFRQRFSRHVAPTAESRFAGRKGVRVATYLLNDPELEAQDFDHFFVGWKERPSSQAALRAVKNSHAYVVARSDSEGTKGRVVGFASAISDGVLCAYIPLLEVLPEFQRRGVGTEVMWRLLAELKGLRMIDLVCDPEVQPFYERLGMRPASAMIIRTREAFSSGTAREGKRP
jgi:GNAT superfamily N-acetyltransferase